MVRSLVLVVVVAVALAYGGWLQVLPAPAHVGAVSEASCVAVRAEVSTTRSTWGLLI